MFPSIHPLQYGSHKIAPLLSSSELLPPSNSLSTIFSQDHTLSRHTRTYELESSAPANWRKGARPLRRRQTHISADTCQKEHPKFGGPQLPEQALGEGGREKAMAVSPLTCVLRQLSDDNFIASFYQRCDFEWTSCPITYEI